MLIVDGPEKAGKSTLIHALSGLWDGGFQVRRWGPVTSDVVYLDALKTDVQSSDLVVWDRSWASEHVYGVLLNRPGRRLAADPWLGEWLYGRAADLKVLVTSHSDERQARRDETDLPVDPFMEQAMFLEHCLNHDWQRLHNDYTEKQLRVNADGIVTYLQYAARARGNPPVYCGPQDSPVVVVGEARNEAATFEGAWLPLTSRLTIPLGRALGSTAVRVGWTNAHDAKPATLRGAKLLVALGKTATTFCKFHVGHDNVLELPHPAWLYRYGKARGKIEPVEAKLRQQVYKYLEVTK